MYTRIKVGFIQNMGEKMNRLKLRVLKTNEVFTAQKVSKPVSSRTAMDGSAIVFTEQVWEIVEEGQTLPEELNFVFDDAVVGDVIIDEYEVIEID